MKLKMIAVASVAAIALSACGGYGKGMEAKLDASQGYDVNYHASLAKAVLDMTKEQQKTYSWLVANLSQEYFIAYYGKTPTVKEVMQGQLSKFTETNTREFAEQTALLVTKAAEIAEAKAAQKKARDLLHSITTTLKVTPLGASPESTCKGIACESTNEQLILADYVVNNPRHVVLAALPCYAEFTQPGKPEPTSVAIGSCHETGRYQYKVSLPKDVDVAKSTVTIKYDDDKALTTGFMPAIPEDHPDELKMKKIIEIRGKIAEAKGVVGL